MIRAKIPAALPVVQACRGLLNKDVKLKALPPSYEALPGKRGWYIGVYDDGHAEVEGLLLCDLTLTASLGAALTLIAPRVAQEAVKAGILSTDLVENAQEVINVLANSFELKRVRLVSFVRLAGPQPVALENLLNHAGQRSDYEVEVAGYQGPGRLVLLGHTLAPAP